jgi:hypothetical protein
MSKNGINNVEIWNELKLRLVSGFATSLSLYCTYMYIQKHKEEAK